MNDFNIIEPIMYVYHDFNYVNYIMGLQFKEAYQFYKLCIKRLDQEHEEVLKNRLWQSYIKECQNGNFKFDFETYYKMRTTNNDKIDIKQHQDSKENEILKKHDTSIDFSKYKRRKI